MSRSNYSIVLTVARFEDLLRCCIVVSDGIVRIAVLIENVRIGNLHFQSMGDADVRFRRIERRARRRTDDLGAQRAENVDLFLAHLLGHDDDASIVLHGTRQGETNARVARRRFDDRVAWLQRSIAFGLFNHAKANAILHTAARIEKFQFGH